MVCGQNHEFHPGMWIIEKPRALWGLRFFHHDKDPVICPDVLFLLNFLNQEGLLPKSVPR